MRFVTALAVAAIAIGLMSPRAASAQNSYNGGYFGLTTGYGWGTSTQTGLLPPPPSPQQVLYYCGDGIYVTNPSLCDDAKLRTKGGLIGGALGWNVQYGTWIFGIEGDYSYAAITGQSNACGNIPHTCGTRLESLGTARGRVGTLFNDWMLYATGGWAFGEVSGYSVAKSAGQAMYSGWTIGGGVEKRFAPQWSLKLEYLYTDLGGKDLYQAPVAGFPEHVAYKLNTIRVGINYYFEPTASPRPIITKGPSLK
jgi:outer membrane immunogenic protein